MNTETTPQDTAQQDIAQQPQDAPEATEETPDHQAAQETAQEPPSAPDEPLDSDGEQEPDEPVDWATLMKTRREAAGLRRRYREAEKDRDQALERVTELEAQIEQFQTQQQDRDTRQLRARIITERGLPDAALDLITGTTEDEITAELDKVVSILATPTPGGPLLRATSGEPSKPADWSSVVKGR